MLIIIMSLISLPIVPPVIPECTAADGVNNDQEDEEYDVDNSHLLPISLEVLQ